MLSYPGGEEKKKERSGRAEGKSQRNSSKGGCNFKCGRDARPGENCSEVTWGGAGGGTVLVMEKILEERSEKGDEATSRWSFRRNPEWNSKEDGGFEKNQTRIWSPEQGRKKYEGNSPR